MEILLLEQKFNGLNALPPGLSSRKGTRDGGGKFPQPGIAAEAALMWSGYLNANA
jgi:hypothetical protein